DDQELILESLALKPMSPQGAHAAAGAVRGDQPVTLQMVFPVGRPHGDPEAIVEILDRGYAVLPTKLDQFWKLADPFDQVLLDVVLLKVDECGHLVATFGQQVELIELAVAVVDAPHLPGDPLGGHPPRHAQPVEDLERPFRPADRPAAVRNRVVVIEDHAGHPLLRKIDRSRKTHGPGADNSHRAAFRAATGQFIGRAIAKALVSVAAHRTSQCTANAPTVPCGQVQGRNARGGLCDTSTSWAT